MSTIAYLLNPPLTDAVLNALCARSWPLHTTREFEPVLRRSLGFVGAFAGDRLIGFVNVATDGGAHAFLLDPTVDPDHRRRGIGLHMVGMAAKLARDAGCDWLHVDYEPRLIPFYERAGFASTAAGVMHLVH